MSVKIQQEDEFYTDFRFDNGDISKLKEVIEKWGFKDYQSFFRFVISILLVTEDQYLAILSKGEVTPIKPNYEYLEQKK